MLRILWGQLRYRPSRAGALGAGILLAAVSFILLASAAKMSEVRVRGSIESAFRPAYDILVRPRGSFGDLERSQGLVRDNYLSGIFGGITLEQHEKIKRIRGVEIAAPVANLGYVLPFQDVRVPLDDLLSTEARQFYRLKLTWLAHNGTSRYPDDKVYVYYTRRNRFRYGSEGIVEVVPGRRELEVCDGFRLGKLLELTEVGPFVSQSYLACFSKRSPGQGYDAVNPRRYPVGKVGSLWTLHFPLLVAAIDPVAESRLIRLDKAIVAGRYLRHEDRSQIVSRPRFTSVRYRAIPVIASTKTYVNERLQVEIEHLRVPRGADIPQTLASPRAYRFLTRLPGRLVDRRLIGPDNLYERLLRKYALESTNYWAPSDVRYGTPADRRLAPLTTANPPEVWKSPVYAETGYYPAPPANADLQFRRLTAYIGSHLIGAGNVIRTPRFEVVGRFAPDKLPGFNPLSRVPLETYYPPLLQPADEASRRALGGKPLLPTQNLGDYIQQPPLLLTTLEAMKPFLNPVFFKGTKGRAEAPISVIRIRVKGVRGPDELSMARIRAVALAIRERTGLAVDITAGSSPRELLVQLPPGKFGRPQLLLEEGWVKKGVSVAFLEAVDRKSLALTALILVICGFFLANGAFAAVRARRTEIGTLLCLGWSQGAIFRTILGELALIGLLAGLLGTGIAAVLVASFSLDISLARTLLVLPVAVALAVLAGLVPASLAARSVPLDAVRPAIAGSVHGQRVQSLVAMALANLRRVPTRTLVGTAGLFVGVAALTLLLAINSAFAGTLVGTLLGEAILLQIKGVDFASVALVIALAGLALADVLFLNLRERAPELVTLRTVGWSGAHLRRLVELEALGLGLLGGLGGGAFGLALGALFLDVPVAPLALAAALAALGGVLVALLASLAPLSQINRLTPPAVLAEE